MKKGFIITLEGGDACGKTTQRALFEDYLKEKGIDYISLREPGSSPVGEEIRNILLHKDYNLNPLTETLLFNASRCELCEKIIKPALSQGKLVLLDRFYHSTLVYQGYSVGFDTDKLMSVINFAIDGIKPDMTIYFHLPAEISYERKVKENNQDRFESRDFDYYKKIENGYLTLAKKDKNMIVIDATKTIEEIHKEVVDLFEKKYFKKK